MFFVPIHRMREMEQQSVCYYVRMDTMVLEGKKWGKVFFFGIGLVFFISIGFYLYFAKGHPTISSGDMQIRATVGPLSLTEKDVQRELAIQKAYGANNPTEEDALHVLINDATEIEVARAHGVLPDAGAIAAFSQHVDTSTKAPSVLGVIKNIFGTDTNSYNRIYLLPKVTNVALQSFFASSTTVHQGEDVTIQKALQEIRAGGSFQEVAKSLGLLYEPYTFPPTQTNGMLPPPKSPSSQPLPEGIKNLTPNGPSTGIIDAGQNYIIIRLLLVTGSTYHLESIISPKLTYGAWYEKEVKNISIKIFPPNL